MTLFPGLPLLIFILLALGIMLGVVKPKRMGKFLLWLILGPVLTGVAFALGKQVFASLTPLQQAIFVILGSVAAFAIVLRLVLPKGVWDSLLGDLIYDLLRSVMLLPFRMLGWLVNLIVQRGKPQDSTQK